MIINLTNVKEHLTDGGIDLNITGYEADKLGGVSLEPLYKINQDKINLLNFYFTSKKDLKESIQRILAAEKTTETGQAMQTLKEDFKQFFIGYTQVLNNSDMDAIVQSVNTAIATAADAIKSNVAQYKGKYIPKQVLDAVMLHRELTRDSFIKDAILKGLTE